MQGEDYIHLAQCCQSLRHLIGKEFPKEEFDRFIDRLVWMIQASPGGVSKDFNHKKFVDRCNGIGDLNQ